MLINKIINNIKYFIVIYTDNICTLNGKKKKKTHFK